MERERQSISVDFETDRATVMLDSNSGVSDIAYLEKPNKLKLQRDEFGNILSLEYEGYDVRQVLAVVNSRNKKGFKLPDIDASVVIVAVMVFLASFLVVSAIAKSPQPSARPSTQFLN